MTDRELMQQALHALELIDEAMPFPVAKLTIKNLGERLAQPEQEPVCDKDPQGCWSVRCQLGKVCKHAAPRQWQGLTEERIEELAKESDLDWHKHWNDDESNRLEKFAELIVRECAGLFPNVYVEIENEYGHTPVIAADYIKKHFGVEE